MSEQNEKKIVRKMGFFRNYKPLKIKKKKIKRFQELLMNAVPAEYYFFLNGWILRFTGGIIYRANSVFPLEYRGKNIENDIEIVENAYNSYGLPPVFTMHEHFEPKNLDLILKKRGYKECYHTNALISKIDEKKTNEINSNYSYEIYDQRIEVFSNFLATYSNKDKIQQEILNKIANRIKVPKKCFNLARIKNQVVGTLMGVLNPEGYLYLSDLVIHPDYRREKLATSLIHTLITQWAIKNKAKYIWLQVEEDNYNANKLYEKLGMKRLYHYYYLKA